MWNALDLGVELVIEGILGVWCGGKGWGIGTNDVDVPGRAEEAEGASTEERRELRTAKPTPWRRRSVGSRPCQKKV